MQTISRNQEQKPLVVSKSELTAISFRLQASRERAYGIEERLASLVARLRGPTPRGIEENNKTQPSVSGVLSEMRDQSEKLECALGNVHDMLDEIDGLI